MESKTLVLRLKEGKTIHDVLPLAPMSAGIQVEPLFEIKNQVNAMLKSSNISLAAVEDHESYFFNNIYSSKAEEEKRLYRTYKISFNNPQDAKNMKAQIEASGNTDFVEEDGINHLHFINDPLISNLYALGKLQCFDAWSLSKGENITVAVIDTGVDYTHPDIKGNMWQDENGNFGRDFSEETNDPMDYEGHGTHVAGTIAATGNNATGIIGIAPLVKIMALKIFPSGTDSAAHKAIMFAVDNGANIINNSWGPVLRRERSELLNQAIDYALSKGVVMVFAAGNNNDDIRFYAPTNHPGVISVAATDTTDIKAIWSNHGPGVTVAAPGVSILSLEFRTGQYALRSGTSMAAPHVSAVCALLLSHNPALQPDEIKQKLMNTVDALQNNPVPIGSGRINALRALHA